MSVCVWSTWNSIPFKGSSRLPKVPHGSSLLMVLQVYPRLSMVTNGYKTKVTLRLPKSTQGSKALQELTFIPWPCMKIHKLACVSMSLPAVLWACWQFYELACSCKKFSFVILWAAHKNLAVLVSLTCIPIGSILAFVYPSSTLYEDRQAAKYSQYSNHFASCGQRAATKFLPNYHLVSCLGSEVWLRLPLYL